MSDARACLRCSNNFNPRLREGGDGEPQDSGGVVTLFQSTPPRRRRLIDFPSRSSIFIFQSTPPRRRRPHRLVNDLNYLEISIHASAKEATMLPPLQLYFSAISIHASAKEATLQQPVSHHPQRISIHASAKEATSSHTHTMP